MATPSRPVYDLLIVGGGTGGWATALHARRAGLTVRLWDAPIPQTGERRVKPCGEGLAPAALREIQDLCGQLPPGAPFAGIEYRHGSRVARAAFPSGPGLGVPRQDLLALLSRFACQAGTDVTREKSHSWTRTPLGVEVDGVPGRILVAADGLKSKVRQAFGLQASRGRPARWGARTHASVKEAPTHVVVYWGKRAELYVTPVARDRVNLAVLAPLDVTLDMALGEFSAELKLYGAPESSWLGAGPFGAVPRCRTAEAFACVGDAAGFVDPITGEGNRLALQGARALVASVVAGRLASYESEWRRLARHYTVLTRSLLWARRRIGPERIVALAAARPEWFRALVAGIAEA